MSASDEGELSPVSVEPYRRRPSQDDDDHLEIQAKKQRRRSKEKAKQHRHKKHHSSRSSHRGHNHRRSPEGKRDAAHYSICTQAFFICRQKKRHVKEV